VKSATVVPHFGVNPPHTLEVHARVSVLVAQARQRGAQAIGNYRAEKQSPQSSTWSIPRHRQLLGEHTARARFRRIVFAMQHNTAAPPSIWRRLFPNTPRTITGRTLAEDGARYVTDILRNWCRQNTLITCRTSSTLVRKTRSLLLENTIIREPRLRRVQQSITL
jgi:hypothetical protein